MEQAENEPNAGPPTNIRIESVDKIGGTADPGVRKGHTHITRRRVVFFLLAIIAATILVPFLLLIVGFNLTEKYWEYLHIVFPAEIGILGSALAFYFDRRSDD